MDIYKGEVDDHQEWKNGYKEEFTDCVRSWCRVWNKKSQIMVEWRNQESDLKEGDLITRTEDPEGISVCETYPLDILYMRFIITYRISRGYTFEEYNYCKSNNKPT